MDKELIRSEIRKHKAKAKRHFFIAMFCLNLGSLAFAIFLYHSDLVNMFVDRHFISFTVAAIVLPVHTLLVYALCTFTDFKFWERK